ncbi:MAG: hypothetical protein ACYCO3_15890, partial [Mycobacteriales bacterium]
MLDANPSGGTWSDQPPALDSDRCTTWLRALRSPSPAPRTLLVANVYPPPGGGPQRHVPESASAHGRERPGAPPSFAATAVGELPVSALLTGPAGAKATAFGATARSWPARRFGIPAIAARSEPSI